jgi:hypothetical protein
LHHCLNRDFGGDRDEEIIAAAIVEYVKAAREAKEVPSEKDYRPANGDSPASKGTRILCEEKLQVSEKFTTDEAIKYLESAKSVLAFYPDEFMCNAIIARLRAADALYEAIILDYMVRVSPGVSHYDIMPKKLRKATADYEEA